MRGNSATAGRQAADQIAEQDQRLASGGKKMLAFATGKPIAFARHVASILADSPAATGAVNDRVAEQLGALTSPPSAR